VATVRILSWAAWQGVATALQNIMEVEDRGWPLSEYYHGGGTQGVAPVRILSWQLACRGWPLACKISWVWNTEGVATVKILSCPDWQRVAIVIQNIMGVEHRTECGHCEHIAIQILRR
jgi:hypothetical protein